MSIFSGITSEGSLIKKVRSCPKENEKVESLSKEMLEDIDAILSSLSLQSEAPRRGGKAKRSEPEAGSSQKRARTDQYQRPSGEIVLSPPALSVNTPSAENSRKRARINQDQSPAGEVVYRNNVKNQNSDEKEEIAPTPIAALPVANTLKRPYHFEGMVSGGAVKRERTASYQSLQEAVCRNNLKNPNSDEKEEIAPAPIAALPVANTLKRPYHFEEMVSGGALKRERTASYQSLQNEIHFGFLKC